MEPKSKNFQRISSAAAENLAQLVGAESPADHGATVFGVVSFLSFYIVRRTERTPDGTFDHAAITEAISMFNKLLHGMVGEAMKFENARATTDHVSPLQ